VATFPADLGRCAPSLRGAGLPKDDLTRLYSLCYAHARIPCLDYIETVPAFCFLDAYSAYLSGFWYTKIQNKM
jgi:hypothetical protein